jgi:hypothetical protein
VTLLLLLSARLSALLPSRGTARMLVLWFDCDTSLLLGMDVAEARPVMAALENVPWDACRCSHTAPVSFAHCAAAAQSKPRGSPARGWAGTAAVAYIARHIMQHRAQQAQPSPARHGTD